MKEIKDLLHITKSLKKQYNRSFTLDGRLVGDIGEVLAAEKYNLELLPENTPIHDARERSSGKLVQIKSSFKGYCYFPYSLTPDYILYVKILEIGDLEEIYNGRGLFLVDKYIKEKALKPFKNHYYTLSKGVLEKLNKMVAEDDRIG